MASPRPPADPTPGRRRQPASLPLPPGVDSRTSARDLLLRSWAGRLFIIATLLKLIVAGLRSLGDLPTFVQVLSSAATIGLAISIVFFVSRLISLVNRRLLWRVRRKLILSYIFIGVVPALLLGGFFVLGAWVLSLNVSAYLFKDGYDDVVKNATLLADAAAAEIARKPETTRETIERVQRNGSRSLRYPNVSMVFLPVSEVDGKVVDAASQPVVDAKVTIEAVERPDRKYEIRTNKRGEFTQIGLGPGKYRFTAEKGGMRQAVSRRISGQLSEVNLVLRAGGAVEAPVHEEDARSAARTDLGIVRAGPWDHVDQPVEVPDWVQKLSGFAGTLAVVPQDRGGDAELIVRAAKPVDSGARRVGYVVADVPVDGEILDRLYDVTSVRAGSVRISAEEGSPVIPTSTAPTNAASGGGLSLFRQSVTFLDVTDWPTGTLRRATVSMTYKPGELYSRLARAQSTQFGPVTMAQGILLMLVFVAVLFLVIEIIALIMGLALARSITSSIHELFMGTERVRQGDFAHRIDIRTKDQLGELADSFNQMTGSIENLLQTAAEKKRLEEELRIARQIQMSLLPRGPLDVPGLMVTALCVPAREVGGDYYDFFPLADGRLGVLIADVAGKGTSAALYMAELKGLVLSLSQIYQSPRQLLIEVNRILSENLDSRSFITMTYAVLDLAGSTMTYARAGHTPLIYLPGSAATAVAQILTPSGMVLGLRIDGAAEKFAELLEEQCVPLQAGAIIVLYTDGITEAMNTQNDLFGESRLSRIVEEHGHLDSGELRERILREIEAFVGSADQHDDMTMILMKVDTAIAEKVAV